MFNLFYELNHRNKRYQEEVRGHYKSYLRLNPPLRTFYFSRTVVVKAKTAVLLQMLVFVENGKIAAAMLNFQNPSSSIKPLL